MNLLKFTSSIPTEFLSKCSIFTVCTSFWDGRREIQHWFWTHLNGAKLQEKRYLEQCKNARLVEIHMGMILLMEEILSHLLSMKPSEKWDILQLVQDSFQQQYHYPLRGIMKSPIGTSSHPIPNTANMFIVKFPEFKSLDCPKAGTLEETHRRSSRSFSKGVSC